MSVGHHDAPAPADCRVGRSRGGQLLHRNCLGPALLEAGLPLSLADRVCLALARSLFSLAYTADRAWQEWVEPFGVRVSVIR